MSGKRTHLPSLSPVRSPIVVKLGGSLYPRVAELVPILRASGRPLLVIPGGGMFADVVRKSGAEEDFAHWMAIASMDQYGWFVSSHGIPATMILKIPDHPVVFLPYCCMRRRDPLPHTWDVTSDSIAAWVADLLRLDLLLLKSVDGIFDNGNLVEQVTTPIRTDVVDPFFIPFVQKKKIRTMIINGSCVDRVQKFLKGEQVSGTRISTTF